MMKINVLMGTSAVFSEEVGNEIIKKLLILEENVISHSRSNRTDKFSVYKINSFIKQNLLEYKISKGN